MGLHGRSNIANDVWGQVVVLVNVSSSATEAAPGLSQLKPCPGYGKCWDVVHRLLPLPQVFLSIMSCYCMAVSAWLLVHGIVSSSVVVS